MTGYSWAEHERVIEDVLDRHLRDRSKRTLAWGRGPDEWQDTACPDCGCDPYNDETLGRHGGAACINPECGCWEPS